MAKKTKAKKTKAPCLTEDCRKRRAAKAARRKSAPKLPRIATRSAAKHEAAGSSEWLNFKFWGHPDSEWAGIDAFDGAGKRIVKVEYFGTEIAEFETFVDLSLDEQARVFKRTQEIAKKRIGVYPTDPLDLVPEFSGLRGTRRKWRRR